MRVHLFTKHNNMRTTPFNIQPKSRAHIFHLDPFRKVSLLADQYQQSRLNASSKCIYNMEFSEINKKN